MTLDDRYATTRKWKISFSFHDENTNNWKKCQGCLPRRGRKYSRMVLSNSIPFGCLAVWLAGCYCNLWDNRRLHCRMDNMASSTSSSSYQLLIKLFICTWYFLLLRDITRLVIHDVRFIGTFSIMVCTIKKEEMRLKHSLEYL